MKNRATAVWRGRGTDGTGLITSKSNVLKDASYSYRTRFEGGVPGTNPEELIASAHAACFAMKLAFVLEAEGYTPSELNSDCEVTLEAGTITSAHLFLSAKIPGISKETFDELVENSGKNCPISKLFNAEVKIQAELI